MNNDATRSKKTYSFFRAVPVPVVETTGSAGVTDAPYVVTEDSTSSLPNSSVLIGSSGITVGPAEGGLVTLSPTYGTTAGTICQGNDSRLSSDSYIWAPDPTVWTSTGVYAPVSQAPVIRIGDYLYSYGGMASGRNYSSSATDKIYRAPWNDCLNWTDTGNVIPTALCSLRAVVLDTTIYFLGTQGEYATILGAFMTDPTTVMSTGVSLPMRADHGAYGVAGDKIYIIGGYTGASGLSSAMYASISNPTAWSTVSNVLPGLTWECGNIVIDGRIYVIGGINYNQTVTTITSDMVRANSVGTGAGSNTAQSPELWHVGNNVYMFGGGNAYLSVSPDNTLVQANSVQFRPIDKYLANSTGYLCSDTWIDAAGYMYYVQAADKLIYRSTRTRMLKSRAGLSVQLGMREHLTNLTSL